MTKVLRSGTASNASQAQSEEVFRMENETCCSAEFPEGCVTAEE